MVAMSSSYTRIREKIALVVTMPTLVDSGKTKDFKELVALQLIHADTTAFKVPSWDPSCQKKVPVAFSCSARHLSAACSRALLLRGFRDFFQRLSCTLFHQLSLRDFQDAQASFPQRPHDKGTQPILSRSCPHGSRVSAVGTPPRQRYP